MGPMTAGHQFLKELKDGEWPRPNNVKVARLRASLHGSLAFTGIGHATDRAVILGLCGHLPADIDPDQMDMLIGRVNEEKKIRCDGHPAYDFDPKTDLVMDRRTPLPGHANGLAFEALDADGRVLLRRVYYSIGGGFIVTEEELNATRAMGAKKADTSDVPYPFAKAKAMLEMAAKSGLTIAEMKRANEETRMSRA